MTDPVRPVAPREELIADLRYYAARLQDRIRTPWESGVLQLFTQAANALAAAPVPCAASPADPQELIAEWERCADALSPENQRATGTVHEQCYRSESRAYRRCAEELKAAVTPSHPFAGQHRTAWAKWRIALDAAHVPCAASPADLWQPIETAPKDGTQVWAWDDERGSNPALFACEAEAWLITYDDEVIHPTHWMPLPSPPRATGEGARDAVYESDSRHADNAAPERRRDTAAMDDGVTLARDAAAADTGRVGRAEGHRAGDHAGLPPERSSVGQADAAPVAVSLDPHRLLDMKRLRELATPTVEAFTMLMQMSGHGDFFSDAWQWELREALASYGEMLLTHHAARLRGEATVRVEE